MATEPVPGTLNIPEEYKPFQYHLMSGTANGLKLPTHLDLPESDGKPMENFEENPQADLISQSIGPILQARHPDGNYCIGKNTGIYWIMAEPALNGCKAPDWFYVPGVPQMLEGKFRRSYVMWQDKKSPFLLLEFVSKTGADERDTTPMEGKFWIYENAIRAEYYGILDWARNTFELYHRVAEKYQPVPANERGHYPVPELGIELGLWHGLYERAEGAWLRLWDAQGNLLLHAEERAAQERERAAQERERADKLAAQLRTMGIDPDKL